MPKQTNFKKIISLVLAISFLFGSADVASALAPTSRFKPIVNVNSESGKITITANENMEETGLDPDLQNDASFMYLSQVISQALYLDIADPDLADLKIEIEQKLSHLINPAIYIYRYMYLMDGSIYLPYKGMLLRFFKPGEEKSDKTSYEMFPGVISVSLNNKKPVLMELVTNPPLIIGGAAEEDMTGWGVWGIGNMLMDIKGSRQPKAIVVLAATDIKAGNSTVENYLSALEGFANDPNNRQYAPKARGVARLLTARFNIRPFQLGPIGQKPEEAPQLIEKDSAEISSFGRLLYEMTKGGTVIEFLNRLDPRRRFHSIRVAAICCWLADGVGIPADQRNKLVADSLAHEEEGAALPPLIAAANMIDEKLSAWDWQNNAMLSLPIEDEAIREFLEASLCSWNRAEINAFVDDLNRQAIKIDELLGGQPVGWVESRFLKLPAERLYPDDTREPPGNNLRTSKRSFENTQRERVMKLVSAVRSNFANDKKATERRTAIIAIETDALKMAGYEAKIASFVSAFKQLVDSLKREDAIDEAEIVISSSAEELAERVAETRSRLKTPFSNIVVLASSDGLASEAMKELRDNNAFLTYIDTEALGKIESDEMFDVLLPEIITAFVRKLSWRINMDFEKISTQFEGILEIEKDEEKSSSLGGLIYRIVPRAGKLDPAAFERMYRLQIEELKRQA